MNETIDVGSMRVWVRGWLHGNVVRIGRDLVDSGYHTGVRDLIDWIGGPVDHVYLTHVHSDHAGGIAGLREVGDIEVIGHPDAAEIVGSWDRRRLWLEGTGQDMPRFGIDREVGHGDRVHIGGLGFQVVHTPGHATGGVCYLSDDGVLIAGDALWERGFGILNPPVDGDGVFEQAALALDRIAAVGARMVIPGHGPPFSDVAGALARARALLERMRDPVELRRRSLVGAVGFWALIDPSISGKTIRERLVERGVPADAAWIDPLLAKLGR